MLILFAWCSALSSRFRADDFKYHKNLSMHDTNRYAAVFRFAGWHRPGCFGPRSHVTWHLFVFRNREESKIKILYWDRDGYAIWYKRLEKGTFKLPTAASGFEVETTEFMMLLQAVESRGLRKKQRYSRNGTGWNECLIISVMRSFA
jgi:hypothetical protein